MPLIWKFLIYHKFASLGMCVGRGGSGVCDIVVCLCVGRSGSGACDVGGYKHRMSSGSGAGVSNRGNTRLHGLGVHESQTQAADCHVL